MSSILVLTPLALEHAALAEALSPLAKHTENTHNGVKVLSFGDVKLDLAVGGHGKVQFALSTQLLIQKFKPSLVICAGAAGALNRELNLLDVVIGETTVEHDFNLRFVAGPLPAFAACKRTIDTLRRRDESGKFRVHFGVLASGDEDIVSGKRAAEIQKLTGALAVAWEGAGGARACRLHGVPFVEIRSITDGSDESSPRTFTENVKNGMVHVAEVIQRIL